MFIFVLLFMLIKAETQVDPTELEKLMEQVAKLKEQIQQQEPTAEEVAQEVPDKVNEQTAEKVEEKPVFKEQVVAGIDLGTTFSCLHLYTKSTGKPILVDFDGQPTLPSIVTLLGAAVKGKVEKLVGHRAVQQRIENPNLTSFGRFKTTMGLGEKEINEVKHVLPYDIKIVKEGEHSTIMILHKINGKVVGEYSPITLSSYVLKFMADRAKEYIKDASLGELADVVVTVPAYFAHNQVDATKTAAEHAGLGKVTIMNEPVAAAYAFQTLFGDKADKYLVFDMGGGTLDISVVEYDDKVLEVKAYAGDNFLGGENVNDLLYKELEVRIKKEIKPAEYKHLLDLKIQARLRAFTEKFKIKLCTQEHFTRQNENGGETIHSDTFALTEDVLCTVTMNYKELETMCLPLADRIRALLDGGPNSLNQLYKNNAHGDISQISKVLLVGGSSRIPWVRDLLAKVYGKHKLNSNLNPDLCVSQGASLFAAYMAELLEPEHDLTFVDALTLNIGIATAHDVFESILKKNSALPVKETRTFTTYSDYQKYVSIRVAQGLRTKFTQNFEIGNFDLEIKNPLPKGQPKIEVTITMDTERNIHVEAVDKATNQKAEVKFASADLFIKKDQMEHHHMDAERNKEKDEEFRMNHEARVQLESYIENTRSRLSSLSEESKKTVELALNETNSWLQLKEGADRSLVNEKMESLKQIVEQAFKAEEGAGYKEQPREDL